MATYAIAFAPKYPPAIRTCGAFKYGLTSSVRLVITHKILAKDHPASIQKVESSHLAHHIEDHVHEVTDIANSHLVIVSPVSMVPQLYKFDLSLRMSIGCRELYTMLLLLLLLAGFKNHTLLNAGYRGGIDGAMRNGPCFTA